MKIKNMAYWKAKNNTPLKKEMGPYKPFDVDKDVIEKDKRESSEDKMQVAGFKPASGEAVYKNWTIIDSRSDEEKKKEQEKIAEEEELKKKEQAKYQQQIDGTYIETEEDVKKRKEKWKNITPNRPK